MDSNVFHVPVQIEQRPLLERMAQQYGLKTDIFERTVAAMAFPNSNGRVLCSREEMIACLVVAHEHNLNPLTKEIYFMKTKGGTLQPIVSVDGWAKKLNAHPQFDGVTFVDNLDANGKLLSITCRVHRKDRAHPIEVTEYLDECSQNGGPVWKTAPKRMLRHRALTQAARYAIGFAGVMDRDEFDQWTVTVEEPKRKSSAEAKRDGTTETFNAIREKIAMSNTKDMLLQVRQLYSEEWESLPQRWHEMVEADFSVKLEELEAVA